MSLESLNRNTLTRICDADQRAIRFFEGLTETVQGLEGGRQTVPTPSGSTIDLSGIPDWANEITIAFDGLTLSGAANVLVQLGTVSGLEITGYASTSLFTNGGAVGAVNSDAGFVIWATGGALRGVMVLTRFAADNAWLSTHSVRTSTTQGAHGAGGAKALGGVLTSLTISQTAAATFTGGRISVGYRR